MAELEVPTMTEPPDGQLLKAGRIAELKFNFRTGNLYESAIRETRILVGQYSNEGIASTGKFLAKVADTVLEQFQTIETVFKEIYVHAFEGGPVPQATELWLRSKIQEIVEHQTVRAQDVTQQLCSCFVGAGPDRYRAYVTRLQGVGEKIQQRLNDVVTILV